MTRKNLWPLAAAIAATVPLMLALPVMAHGEFSKAQIHVGYRGLDLASAAGREVLDRRLEAAIRRMCGAPVLATRDEAEALGACRDEARAAVKPQVDKIVAGAVTRVAAN
jgi:UrcA family protein